MTKTDERFQGLHPIFAGLVRRLLEKAAVAGLVVDVFEGYRSFARSDELAQRNAKVSNAKGGTSWHNYGLAVDVVFKDKKGAWSWAEENDWNLLGKCGKSVGLIWGGNTLRGGDFEKMDDRPHFEWHPGFDISGSNGVRKALALWNKTKTLAGVWNALDVKV